MATPLLTSTRNYVTFLLAFPEFHLQHVNNNFILLSVQNCTANTTLFFFTLECTCKLTAKLKPDKAPEDIQSLESSTNFLGSCTLNSIPSSENLLLLKSCLFPLVAVFVQFYENHLVMASNGVNKSLLSGLVNPKPSSNGDAPKTRRFRRSKSAPQADFVNPGITESFPYSKSIFWKPHPNFKKIAAYVAVYLGAGTACFYSVKSQIAGKKTDGVLDSVYFCIVTMTTVGYGDLVPNSILSKLLSCAFVFAGMGVGGLIISKAADYLVEKQEILLVKALHRHDKIGPIDTLKEAETNKVRYKCLLMFIIMLVLIIVGTIFLAIVEKVGFIDAFYCVCSTITTLGYGDVSFSTKGGRVFAVFYILTSTTSLGQFFLYVAELNSEKRQKKLVKWVLNRRMTNVDLEVADIDDDGVVSAAEFIVYKLREMGKISQEDISLVMEEFEELDVDQSGTLSTSDIILAQNPKTQS